jgi:hypothetical protein
MNELYSFNGLLITLLKMDLCEDDKEARVLLRHFMDAFPEVREALLKEAQMGRRYMKDPIHNGFQQMAFHSTFGPV